MKKSLVWLVLWFTALTVLPGYAQAPQDAAAHAVRILLVNPSQGDLEDMVKDGRRRGSFRSTIPN